MDNFSGQEMKNKRKDEEGKRRKKSIKDLGRGVL